MSPHSLGLLPTNRRQSNIRSGKACAITVNLYRCKKWNLKLQVKCMYKELQKPLLEKKQCLYSQRWNSISGFSKWLLTNSITVEIVSTGKNVPWRTVRSGKWIRITARRYWFNWESTRLDSSRLLCALVTSEASSISCLLTQIYISLEVTYSQNCTWLIASLRSETW